MAVTERVTRPVVTAVHRVVLAPTPDRSGVELPQRDASPFSLLGVTWDRPRDVLQGSVQARVRSVATGSWSPWRDLLPQGDDAPDAGDGHGGARGGTAPLWVGPSDGVQLRIDGRRAGAALPAGLRLALVDPGRPVTATSPHVAPVVFVQDPTPTDTTPTDTATTPPVATTSSETTSPATATTDTSTAPATAEPTTSDPVPTATTTTTTPASPTSSAAPTRPTAQPSTAPQPPIVSRAGWGADESIREPGDPDYASQVRVLFVHHTDTASDYACSDAPAIIRSMYAYHVQELHWRDIGYNFLVDKCGTLYEGRYGGEDLPVIGAQTYGFNTNSAGVAVIGTYITSGATNAVQSSLARLAAWKLGMSRISPDATSSTLTEGASDSHGFTKGQTYTFNAVSGHRDGFATQCPGDALYAQLPTIRAWAAGPPSGLRITGLAGATSLAGAWYTKGAVTASWSATSPMALVARTELLVDGAVAATAGPGATSAQATLAPGRHSVQVRAVHVSGRSATSSAATVVADVTAPTFTTRPSVALRGGTTSTGAAPVTLSWRAADNALLRQVSATSPSAATFGAATTAWATAARPGVSTTFALRAIDAAGNTASASVAAVPTIVQETAAARYGPWTSRSSTSYLGGRSLATSARNASLTWTFTGRSVAWIVSRASSSGQAAVYVDGTRVAIVDLRSTVAAYRQAIWTRTWAASARHTLRVVNLATSGRPTITTDGIDYLR